MRTVLAVVEFASRRPVVIILHTVGRAVRFVIAVVADTRALRSELRQRYSVLAGE